MKFCSTLTEILIKFRVAYHLLEFFKHLLVIVMFLFLLAHDGWLHCFCLYVCCRLSINTLYASIFYFFFSLVVAVDTELGQPNVCCEWQFTVLNVHSANSAPHSTSTFLLFYLCFSPFAIAVCIERALAVKHRNCSRPNLLFSRSISSSGTRQVWQATEWWHWNGTRPKNTEGIRWVW